MDLLLTFSCDKKDEYEKPTIRFSQPGNNLIIANDTIISFIVEPYDEDGTIDRVEFTKNGTIVQTVVNSPYTYDWSISSENNIGIYTIKATVYDNHQAKGEAENFSTNTRIGYRNGGDIGKYCEAHCLNQDLQDYLMNKIFKIV